MDAQNISQDHKLWLVPAELLAALAVLLIFYTLTGYSEKKEWKYIDESGIGVLIGVLTGLVVSAINNSILKSVQSGIIFLIFIPPILISRGYSFRKGQFFSSIVHVTLFGLLGTILNFLIIFGLTYLISELKLVRNFDDIDTPISLATKYIALFSASVIANESDPGLVLLNRQRHKKLHNIMLGESLLNDTLSIVLFVTVIQTTGVQEKYLDFDSIHNYVFLYVLASIGWFLVITLVSIASGLFFGVICTLYFKHFRFMTQSAIVETLIVIFFGFCAYSFSEIFYFSGALSILVYSLVVAHYNYYNLSRSGQMSSGVFLRMFSLFCESFIYIFVGCYCWVFSGDSNQYLWSWTFFLLELFIILISRILSIALIVVIFKRWLGQQKWNLNFNEIIVITFGGIVRGSLSFALIFSIDAPLRPGTTRSYDSGDWQIFNSFQVVQSTILFISAFTIVIYGFIAKWITLKQLLVLKQESSESQIQSGNASYQAKQEQPLLENINQLSNSGINDQSPDRKQRGKVISWLMRFDEQTIKPTLIYNYKQRKDELKKIKRVVKANHQRLSGKSDLYQYFLVASKPDLDQYEFHNQEDFQSDSNSIKRSVKSDTLDSV